jgi:hypothetical protein
MSPRISRSWLILLLILLLMYMCISRVWAAPAPHAPAQGISLPQAEGEMEVVGHLGGWGESIILSEDAHYAFLGVGSALHTFDVSNPAQLTQISALDVNGAEMRDLARAGNILYAASYLGLSVIDVADPAHPALLEDEAVDGALSGVAVVGSTLYLASRDLGLLILDVSTPASPQLLGTFAMSGEPGKVQVAGQVAYVTCTKDYKPCAGAGLITVDVHDPAHPTQLGAYETTQRVWNLKVVGERAYLAADGAGLLILNVSNPASPALLGSYASERAWDVDVAGDTAYLAAGSDGSLILDVSDPTHPTKLGSYDHFADRIVVAGSRLFTTGQSDLLALDVSQPGNPTLLGQTEWPLSVEDVYIPSTASALGRSDALATSHYGYVAGEGRLFVMDLSRPDLPQFVASVSYSESFADRIHVADGLAYVMHRNYGV